MKTRREFIRVAGASGVGLALAACVGPATTSTTPAPSPSQVRPKYGGTLTLANAFDIGNTDPTTSTGGISIFPQQQMIDPLVRVGRDLTLQPSLAERWEVSSDLQSLTLFLRSGVTYQDGTPFDAESVRWNFERNATHPRTQYKTVLAPVANVQVVDARTVRIALKAPTSSFLAQLTTGLGRMLSRSAVEAGGNAFGDTPHKAGSGPFIMTEAVSNDHITFVRNPNWWGRDAFGGQLPYLDRLIVKVVPDGAVRFTNVRTGSMDALYDISAQDLQVVGSEPSLVMDSVSSTQWWELKGNCRPGHTFSESRYLKAMSMALDRAELLRVAYQGTGVVGYGPISPQHFAFDPNFKPFEQPDIAGARALIAQVGKGPLSFEIQFASGDTGLLQAVQLIQAQLKKADITVKLLGLPTAQWLAMLQGGLYPDVSYLNSGTGNVDPSVRFFDLAHSQGTANNGKYVNADVDRLLEEQQRVADQGQRTQLLRRAEQISQVDFPRSAVIFYPKNYVVSRNDVRGWSPNPVLRPTFENVWLNR